MLPPGFAELSPYVVESLVPLGRLASRHDPVVVNAPNRAGADVLGHTGEMGEGPVVECNEGVVGRPERPHLDGDEPLGHDQDPPPPAPGHGRPSALSCRSRERLFELAPDLLLALAADLGRVIAVAQALAAIIQLHE